jgi:hypothetical protein
MQIAEVAAETNSEVVGEWVNPEGPAGVVADKGYHSNAALVSLERAEVRSYISEPERGRRRWEGRQEEQRAVYGNRRRISSERGKALQRRRGELLERSFAHAYETGGMRRTHLRGRENILKRLLIHLGAFNLGLVMRQLIGKGTPRGLQNAAGRLLFALLWAWLRLASPPARHSPTRRHSGRLHSRNRRRHGCRPIFRKNTASTTGC